MAVASTGASSCATSRPARNKLVSSSSAGMASNGNSSNLGRRGISRDGARVVFNSNATNLFSPAPPAGSYQVYVKTIDTPN